MARAVLKPAYAVRASTILSGFMLFLVGQAWIASYRSVPDIVWFREAPITVSLRHGAVTIARIQKDDVLWAVAPDHRFHVVYHGPSVVHTELGDKWKLTASHVSLPLWLPSLFLAVLPFYHIVLVPLRMTARWKRGKCVVCGYCLIGLPDSHQCPECGASYGPDFAVGLIPRFIVTFAAVLIFVTCTVFISGLQEESRQGLRLRDAFDDSDVDVDPFVEQYEWEKRGKWMPADIVDD